MQEKKAKILSITLGGTALLLILALSRGPGSVREPASAETMASPAAAESLWRPSPSPTAEPTATPYAPAPPALRLLGEDPMVLTAAPEPYSDPGCRALDALDGDLTAQVETVIDVDPYRAGEGSVSYSVTDSEGLTARAVRRVIVEAAPLPEIAEPPERVIYLTFDDGPSANTERLLEILDRYGVQATWFVTHTHPEYTDMIGEIARRGHTVAIHSASHDYGRIYADEAAYFADLREMQDLILEQTGRRSTLLRFPGGSSNTVSCRNPGIMTRLSECLQDMGYVYFDWNVSSADTAPDANYSTVLRNVTEGCAGLPWAVVLQHDTNGFSVEAVPAIIEWGFQNGYIFLPLDEHSPTVHHHIAN